MKKSRNTELEAIVEKVGVPYFMMSVAHLMDVGYRHMTESSVKETVEGIKEMDDKNHFMTNEFKCFIVETAFEISKAAEPIMLAKFTAKYVG